MLVGWGFDANSMIIRGRCDDYNYNDDDHEDEEEEEEEEDDDDQCLHRKPTVPIMLCSSLLHFALYSL